MYMQHIHIYTVKPLNKGHVGGNINSLVLSFVERLSSFWRWSMYSNYKEGNFLGPRAASIVQRSFILCPFLGGSTIGLLEVSLYMH